MRAATIDGADRYLVTRHLSGTDSVLEGLDAEYLDTLTYVHRAERVGMIGVLGLDLFPEQAQRIEQKPGLCKITNLSRLSLGLTEAEPELPINGDAEEWMRDLPDVRDPGEIGCVEDVPRAYTTQTNKTVRTSRFWKAGPTLDQNGEYSSVAFSLTHHLNALPRRNSYDGRYAVRIHRRIEQVESRRELSGPPSLDSGLRALREMGHVSQYRFALTYDSMRKWLLYRGGVSLGMDCYEGMLAPDANGFARPTGNRLGRIAVFCRGVSPWGALRVQYAYGEGFCHRGMAWISRADAMWLMKNDTNFRAACWREAKAR